MGNFLTETFEDTFVDPFMDLVGDIHKGITGDNLKDVLAKNFLGPVFPQSQIAKNILLNSSSSNSFIPVVYGRRKVGGIRNFVGVPDNAKTVLYLSILVSAGEIFDIVDKRINDKVIGYAEYGGAVAYDVGYGAEAQSADADWLAGWPGVITENHRARGIAWLGVRLIYKDNLFFGFPALTGIVQGVKCYDVRTELTAYTKNPALIIYDYLTNAHYGKGLAATLLNTASFIAAADFCETQIETFSGSGAYINLFECNAVVDCGETILDNLNKLLHTCRGMLSYTAGQYHLRIEKDESSTFTFDEDNIVGSVAINSASKDSRFNSVKVNYINPNAEWQSDQAVSSSAEYLSEDNGIALETEVNYDFETDYYRAKYHADTILKRSRQMIACKLTSDLRSLKVECGDIVSVWLETPGWEAKLFRVIEVTIKKIGEITFSLLEHEPTTYDRTIPGEEISTPDTFLPDPFTVLAPTGLTLDSGSSLLIKGNDGSIVSRIRVSWTAAEDTYVTHYEIQYRLLSDSLWAYAPSAFGNTATEAWIVGVKTLAEYQVRVRAINTREISSTWIIANHIVVGESDAPPPVTTFTISIQTDGTRQFYWTYDSKPVDFAGYKIRYAAGLDAVWADMTALHNDLIPYAPWETNLLQAGEYTFAIKAVDRTGNESASAIYIESTLPDPRSKNSLYRASEGVSGWPGTKTDCHVENGSLFADDQTTWADLTTWTDYTRWNLTPKSPITYTTSTIDLGIKVVTVPLINATGVGTLDIEERHGDDGATWSAWANADGTPIDAQYFQLRVIVTEGADIPTLSRMEINFSITTIDEVVNDLVMSSYSGDTNRYTAVGDLRIPLRQSFSKILSVHVTLQNVGAGWSYELIDKALTYGPRIKVYNSTNAPADTTIDVFIRGI